jgi:ATP-dependent RNA helicase DDX20
MPFVWGRRAPLRDRTSDVEVSASDTFAQLHLSDHTMAGLIGLGLSRPSPVQSRAIPIGLFGADVLVQAKSGTGKTLVFSVIAAEQVQRHVNELQALIIAPTREIALQIEQVLCDLTKAFIPPMLVSCFIGGQTLDEDARNLSKGVHIAVGTPGRVLSLIESSQLSCSSLNLLVVDEADKVLDGGMLNQFKSVRHLSFGPLCNLA